jgi:subtilisin family serine protease
VSRFRSRLCPVAAAIAVALLPAPQSGAASLQAVSAQLATPTSVRADATDPKRLVLRAGSYDPLSQRLDFGALVPASGNSTRYALVQFHPDQVGAGRRRLAARGAQVLGYVPNNAYVVRLNGLALDTVAADPAVRATVYRPNALKVAPRLWTNARVALPLQGDGEAGAAEGDVLLLRGFAGESSAAIAAAVGKLVPEARVLARSLRAQAEPGVRVGVPRARLDALIAAASGLEAVAYVEAWAPLRLDNSGSIGTLQGNAMGVCGGIAAVCGPTPIWSQGLYGSGQVVAVYDSGTTPWNAAFTTLDRGAGPLTAITLADDPLPPAIGARYPDHKILAYWLQPGGPVNYDYYSGHGTHTAGTVLGDLAGSFSGSTYLASTPTMANHELADGMAPNAQLLMQDAGGTDSNSIFVADLAASLEQAYAGGAGIHSDSWGGNTRGEYVDLDSAADRAARTAEDLLIVVAAGNSGPGASSIGSPGNAKNVLTVGALGHAGVTQTPPWSSRGPTADGRQKPDVAAPGTDIFSAASSFYSTVPKFSSPLTMSGTSMATPAVSGSAALLRQYFSDGFYPRGVRSAADVLTPSGMAMKAVLINGAQAIGAPGWPNTASGWGRVWLDGNLWFAHTAPGGDDTRRLRLFERTHAAGLLTGETNDYVIEQVGIRTELRATLVWFDPEAAPGAALALVNDLDLELLGPDGSMYAGNAFVADASVAGAAADTVNTVEQVRLPQPVGGRYRLRVHARNVPGNGEDGSDRQGYALVVSGDFGLPDSVPAMAPLAPAIVGNGGGGVLVEAVAPAASTSLQLYRADGSCAAASPGSFRLVAAKVASPLLDVTTQGGRTYAYRLRAVEHDVEGNLSACVDVVSADECTLRPAIAAGSLVADGRHASCSVSLAWQAASATCPGAMPTLRYAIDRATDPFMANAQRIAADLSDTHYTDSSVVDGQVYFYRFIATDSLGNESPRSAIATTTTTSELGPDPAAFADGADGAVFLRPQVGWGLSDLAAADGRYSYHSGGASPYYSDLTCSSIETPTLHLPAAAQLSFAARYNLEYGWDGVTTEISSDGGAHWSDLPPLGGYPMTLQTGQMPPINACGFADGKGVYSGVSTSISNAAPGNDTAIAVFKKFKADLAAYAGMDVKIRWRLSSDPAANYSGFFLDAVRIGDRDVVFRGAFDYSQYMCR